MLKSLALNTLKSADIIFFIALAAIVVLIVAIYFLIPVFNKKQYKEQRDNLKKREVAFKSNVQRTDGKTTVAAQEFASDADPTVLADEPAQTPAQDTPEDDE